jgi:plasmid stabilization system protein ParE
VIQQDAVAARLYQASVILGPRVQQQLCDLLHGAGIRATGAQSANGPTVPLSAVTDIADELRRILEPLGCGRFEVPSADFDYLADQAADAASEAVRDTLRYETPDLSEVESFAETADEAVSAARDLQDQLAALIAEAEQTTPVIGEPTTEGVN